MTTKKIRLKEFNNLSELFKNYLEKGLSAELILYCLARDTAKEYNLEGEAFKSQLVPDMIDAVFKIAATLYKLDWVEEREYKEVYLSEFNNLSELFKDYLEERVPAETVIHIIAEYVSTEYNLEGEAFKAQLVPDIVDAVFKIAAAKTKEGVNE